MKTNSTCQSCFTDFYGQELEECPTCGDTNILIWQSESLNNDLKEDN